MKRKKYKRKMRRLRITERVSPRVFRVVALPNPTEHEKSQMYFQRYLTHFPAAGQVVIFDRSWYNRGRRASDGLDRPNSNASSRRSRRFRATPRCGR